MPGNTRQVKENRDENLSSSSDTSEESSDDSSDSDRQLTDSSGEEDCMDITEDDLFKELLQRKSNVTVERNVKYLNDPLHRKVSKLMMWFLYFFLFWKCTSSISDQAFSVLLSFLYKFFQVLSFHCENMFLDRVAALFPASLYYLRKVMAIDRDDFVRYVTCPNPDCAAVYDYEKCFDTNRRGEKVAKKCWNVPFRKGKYSRPCNTVLFDKVKLKDGKHSYYPKKVYSYRSVTTALEGFLMRDGFEDMCEEWRSRDVKEGEYIDVYDGKIWSDFLVRNTRDFLAAPRNFGLMLNIDWFQPFDRRKDVSVGVIYMVVMNLPRNVRFKRENLIVVGILPALKKEPSNISSFLEPLVSELKCLWNGLPVKTPKHPTGTTVRAALLCAAADIPAARKLCGFLSHSATFGCSKCLKKFPGSVKDGKDYSGFDKENWQARSKYQHSQAIRRLRKCKTKTSLKEMERSVGYRYTALSELEYFDTVRFHVVDPMHNLFLGTAKHIFKLWLSKEILSRDDLCRIEDRMQRMTVPRECGRLPRDIGANYSGFTADQWKNWTTIYSLYALKGILPDADFKCWQIFVCAVRKIVKPNITSVDLDIADLLFAKFGNRVEKLYGKMSVTPNMHLSCHLVESIKDYGSVYGFWLFSFERFNGKMSSLYNNHVRFEVQLMREFMQFDAILNMKQNMIHGPENNFESFVFSYVSEKNEYSRVMGFHFYTPFKKVADCIHSWQLLDGIVPPLRFKKCPLKMDTDDNRFLCEAYSTMYQGLDVLPHNLSNIYFKFDSLNFGSDYFTSRFNRGDKNCTVVASWAGDDGEITDYGDLRPGLISYFIKHTLFINGSNIPHIFAVVKWYKRSDRQDFPPPFSSWLRNSFITPGAASFIPVQRIRGKCAHVTVETNGVKHLVICPLYRHMCI
ncbi:uncharacterized protein LOC106175327 [Lingula anatina]|uniref:Uncharacterized protein LOC106175327 n=1 Tax=Lingula anatina TaxID=7574 RepID=A0A2R2MTF1_LINAN|nr:uncharacterized protein LOC106175327 [Lingula anatina]|eukprot:XP_023933297.1 uncharacterized protein LOC106175327 [Lingula anatina]